MSMIFYVIANYVFGQGNTTYSTKWYHNILVETILV